MAITLFCKDIRVKKWLDNVRFDAVNGAFWGGYRFAPCKPLLGVAPQGLGSQDHLEPSGD